MSLKQPLQTTNVLQPAGVHASNDLESLPQLHFCIDCFASARDMFVLQKLKDDV
jgi:hypothetical protein